jgi:hypothetical protein
MSRILGTGLATAGQRNTAVRPWGAVRKRYAALSGSALGLLPVLSLVGAFGLLIISEADSLSGSGAQGVEPLFWLGVFVIVVPFTLRLLTPRVKRSERLGLVVVFALYLYLVKLLQSPFVFTYSDEFLHLYNANRILETARLFSENPVLPVSPLYPGLEAVTAAVMRLGGLDVFGAGLVVIGLVRLMMTIALFLLFEQLTASARVASLGCLVYTASPNYLFWSAQFAYESLALPLALLALYVVARREAGAQPSERLGLTVMALVVIVAVVVTHHLSAFFLVAVLLLWAVLVSPLRRVVVGWAARWLARLESTSLGVRVGPLISRLAGRPSQIAPKSNVATGGPGGLALFALVASLCWLVYVASLTLTYLSPLFARAAQSLVQMMAGVESGRQLFQSTVGYVAPLLERSVGITAVLLCLIGLPFGLRQVWRRYLHQPLVLVMAAAAVAYFGLLGLRLIPAAWEIGNRSSEYLFVGLALVLATSRFPWPARARGLLRLLLGAAIAVIFAGGIIAGWQPKLRLAQVYEVAVGNQVFQPSDVAAAKWVLAHLGRDRRIAAQPAAGLDLLAYGDQHVELTRQYSIQSIFEANGIQSWQIHTLQARQIEFLSMDRRIIGDDNMIGSFFDLGLQWPLPSDQLLSPQIYTKFNEVPGISRIFDSGDMVIYDIRAWLNAASQP